MSQQSHCAKCVMIDLGPMTKEMTPNMTGITLPPFADNDESTPTTSGSGTDPPSTVAGRS